MPVINSEIEEIPGIRASSFSLPACNKSVVKPGLIANLAPASAERCNNSLLVTVPAPTTASGKCFAIVLITSKAAGVRKVTSKTLTSAAKSASAIGSASSTFFITNTGTIGPMAKRSAGCICQLFDNVIIPLNF